MSVLMMPDAGSHRCGYVSAGRTRPDDERIALVDGELGYASSSVPAGQAVCRAVLLVHRWEDDNSSWAPLIDGSLGSGARSSRSICPLTGCRTVTAACTPKNGTRSRGGGDCRATRPAGDRRGRSLRLQPRRSCRLRGRVRRAHPAGLWRPRLLTAARRGGDVRTPAERPTRSAPRDELGTATPLGP